jgi:hypothetical protein
MFSGYLLSLVVHNQSKPNAPISVTVSQNIELGGGATESIPLPRVQTERAPQLSITPSRNLPSSRVQTERAPQLSITPSRNLPSSRVQTERAPQLSITQSARSVLSPAAIAHSLASGAGLRAPIVQESCNEPTEYPTYIGLAVGYGAAAEVYICPSRLSASAASKGVPYGDAYRYTVTHEMFHVVGETDESETDCKAVAWLKQRGDIGAITYRARSKFGGVYAGGTQCAVDALQ